MPGRDQNDIDAFIRALPDPEAARVFLDRLASLPSANTGPYRRDPLLLSRMLLLAAYSPFLAETLLRHPEHIGWLQRESERDLGHGKSVEQLSEELARFVVRIHEADRRSQLAQFKHRELLRIYLRDCLGVATLAEITEELSNLADVVLDYALALAHQEMTNLHGAPLFRDERGRVRQAEFAIVALGKLGCRELNYASDIDLLFLYSGAGETAGDGRRPETAISNKDFFKGVAERVVRMVGSGAGQGAVYRTDLRLRPYGRDGDLVWDVERAAHYYRHQAHNWERQALIRARVSAGSRQVVSRFLALVRDAVFYPEAAPDAVAAVRRVKEKIDRRVAERTGGFNVKLGRGGIREVEFIAQALQLAHGGREPWVRSAQTLIVLARLAEKGYLSEAERTRLSSAYTFLRTVEHRLQMEHGAQTHTLPLGRERLELLARRCGYSRADAFRDDLESHTSGVRAVYNRVFSEGQGATAAAGEPSPAAPSLDDETERLMKRAAIALEKLLAAHSHAPARSEAMEPIIAPALASSINPARALRNLTLWAESLATYSGQSDTQIARLISDTHFSPVVERLIAILSSQHIATILTSRPVLAVALTEKLPPHGEVNFMSRLRSALAQEKDAAAKADALRREWHRLALEISCRDMLGGASRGAGERRGRGTQEKLRANNLEQTALAEAALQLATEIALESLGIEKAEAGQLPFAIMGLGRLGHTGMDYGSDLDLLVVYDDAQPVPPGGNSPQEFYAKLTATLVRLLSSITREGYLYQIDLRLRPDGNSGPLAQGLNSLITYIHERASAWEHSAYLKAREVAGDLALGKRARHAICGAAFDAAARNPSLRQDLAAMRARLEKEKARNIRRDLKWGRGGMTDVYFITRYLQLRDRIYYPPEEGTLNLIAHLGGQGGLTAQSSQRLYDGYTFLRLLDHWMRLLLDRPSPVLPASQPALEDIARALGLATVEDFEAEYARHTSAIRGVYEDVMRDE